MATGIVTHAYDSPLREAHSLFAEPHWYAAYTRSNHEKQVAGQLASRGVEHFLPLYQTVHRRKDRRVRLNLPLFPSYVFVRLPLRDRLQVLQISGLVHLVGFGGLPTTLPEQEIETLRAGLGGDLRAQPHPYLTAGRRVRITNGPLASMEGILQRRKGNYRIVICVDLIMQAVSVETDVADVIPVPMGRLRQGCD
jgi:transcription antitermination factor NusG